MHCGACGRVIAGQARRCLYCGGAPVEQDVKRDRHLECPACKGLMTEADEGGIMVDRCGACGGAWFDRKEIEHAIKAERERKQELWDHLPAADPKGEIKPKYRDCPICRQVMHRKKRGPALIDLCGPHGVFLDAGELEQIARWKEPPAEPAKQKPMRPGREIGAYEPDSLGVVAGTAAVEVAIEVLWALLD